MDFARLIVAMRVAVFVYMAVLTYGDRTVAAPPVLGSADTMEKVFRDEPWNRPPVTRLTVEAARNEVEGIQLVVVADKESVRSATLEVSDLTGEAGGLISKANVAWNVVGYVDTEQPNYPVRKVGSWPDPLLPPAKFGVPSGQVQPLWINTVLPATRLRPRTLLVHQLQHRTVASSPVLPEIQQDESLQRTCRRQTNPRNLRYSC